MLPAELDTLIRSYMAAWSEPDTAVRQRLLEAVWEEQGSYTDPLSQVTDRAGLEALISRFLASNPAAKFSLKGKIEAHHSHVRFYWLLRLSHGVEIEGMDYGEISAGGKLMKIVGFF
jgi:hypothetical protein